MQVATLKGSHLSMQQARLWAYQQNNTAYLAQCTHLLLGPLQRDILWKALQQAIRRHEILRTTFTFVPGMDIPLQVVSSESEPWWAEINLEDLSVLEQERYISTLRQFLQNMPFSLSQQPVLRTALVRLNAERHILFLALPTLCADASSLPFLVETIKQLYPLHAGLTPTQPEEEEEVLQYADVSAWQRDLLEEEDAESHQAFWQQVTLDRIRATELPFVEDHAVLLQQTASSAREFDPKSVEIPLEPALQAQILSSAQEMDVSPETLLLACWHLCIRRLTGQDDPILGVACDGRHYEELKGAIGLYTRFVPLSIQTRIDYSFAQYIRQTQRTLEQAREEQSYFVWNRLATEENTEQSSPFLPLQFEIEAWPGLPSITADFHCAFIQRICCSEPFVLKMSGLLQNAHQLYLELSFDSRFLSAEHVQRLASTFSTLLRQTLLRPHAPLHSCPLLLPQDAPTLRGPALSLPTLPLHAHIVAIARQYPTLPAVQDEHLTLSYAQLSARSSQLAHLLRARS
ncbi:MAG TPA: condensation domain-containing protein, partial [Ktedonobacteraceae bacterium]|nr:condensation domain-containing protein [Ktedonobacteraceae bacterium]